VLAFSVLILSACGNGEGPADVAGDNDTGGVTDTIGNDTVAPDIDGRDVAEHNDADDNGQADDVVAVDVAGDDIDVEVGQDIPGDTPVGDVSADTVCVPDCSDGPCTDDGCGGECCDAPNVCDRNYAGDAVVCLPPDGTTCVEIGQCSVDCTDDDCTSECYNAGSAEARDALLAVMDCVTAVCPELTQECAVAAYGDGGACEDEYSNCMNACTPDCSDGPCTDDGCGGDCCDAPNVCQTPESGIGLECVVAAEKTCQQIWACANECGDEACAQACINAGSPEGLMAVVTCVNDACGGASQECVLTAIQSGGVCYDEYTACK